MGSEGICDVEGAELAEGEAEGRCSVKKGPSHSSREL